MGLLDFLKKNEFEEIKQLKIELNRYKPIIDIEVETEKQKIGLKSKGRIPSAETRSKMSKAHKGNIPTNTGIPSPKFECTHCHGMYDAGNLKQWHGDNCRTLKLTNNSL